MEENGITQEPVLYEVEDGIAVITLNVVHRRNALSLAVRTGLREAFLRLHRDPDAKVGILTGAGERAFSAGGDLTEMAEKRIGVPERGFVPILNRNLWVDKPVIAAVNGDAIGGGFLLAQSCDLAVSADHARFGMTEAKWGRGAPWSVPLLWMIPQRIWMEMALTGNLISAVRAYEVGLVNAVVPLPQLMDTALQLAATIRDNAPLTVAATRKMIYLAMEMGRTAAWEAADAIFEKVYESEDAQEGPRAFLEKRAPRWRNR